ncbi:MAG: hypothetical protein ACYC2P_06010 [Paludibacteraceae bacterium]
MALMLPASPVPTIDLSLQMNLWVILKAIYFNISFPAINKIYQRGDLSILVKTAIRVGDPGNLWLKWRR